MPFHFLTVFVVLLIIGHNNKFVIEVALFVPCRPPATVLAKPAPVRNRKDSSDAEPSPPNSPSYFEEDHVSSITVSLKMLG